ncbi:major facilitator superfamily domain-containing protein [Leucosporidium creatinivorum]|uniref:Lysosomal dipeptide transporter MFSD1 n=1 Tax=Leucosporidium creatinivorum TaxID=106004 RepID=A0A1Y2E8Q4_9BASI|nr:major facilitator superfamily domain-containing protein [Leucosporidium creatinivorum]
MSSIKGSAPLPASTEPYTDQEKSLDGDLSKTSSAEAVELDRNAAVLARRNIPWAVKGWAFFLVITFNLASYWFSSSLGPLKTTLKAELGIDNAQYGVLSSANKLVNTVMPLISGIAMDYYGAEYTSLAASTVILLGALLSGIGASVTSYGLLVAGEVVVGFGTIAIQTAQLKIFSHFFLGTHLGVVYGLENAANRIVVVVAKATAIPITNAAGWTWVIWVPVFFSGFVFLTNVAYVLWERRLPELYRPRTGRQISATEGGGGLRFELYKSWQTVAALPAIFWLITLSQNLTFQNATVQTYVSLQADMVTQTRGAGLLTAGWISAVGQVPVMVIAPLLGLFFDRYGRRMDFVPISAVFFILVFTLMGFTDTNAIALTILQGVGLAINLLPFTISIPLMVPGVEQVGTAEGIFQAFINSGAVIVSTAAGAIQDLTPTGKGTYTNVFYFFCAIKALDFFFGLYYIYFDRYHLNGLLSRSEKSKLVRDEQLAKGEVVERRGRFRDPIKGWTNLGIVAGVAMTVVAWVVYLVYSQGS